jgi:hypothetical protein
MERHLVRLVRFIAKVESQKIRSVTKAQLEWLTSTNNSISIPSNATIRMNYIRCGKEDCLAERGAYYYAYWKDDKGKLSKKYIGKYPPLIGNINKVDESSPFKDSVGDPSYGSV